MTAYKRGDIVLVNFLFSDESRLKHRPAVVISSPIYHRSRQEIIVAAVTSNIDRMLFGDYLLAGWKEAGLLFPSLVTGIIRTIKSEMIHRRLGSIPPREMTYLDLNLHEILGLKIRRDNN
jgi:mRNA interferase MazF